MFNSNRYSLKSVVRKILAAFLLVSAAIFLALSITRFSFRELMGTVDELSAPNEKLVMLNELFENITTLDQLQRAEAIQNPHKPYSIFLEQSASINTMIDSLTTLPFDTIQMERLDAMKSILNERNQLFFSYLKVKADLLDNRAFSVQLDTLTAILQDDELTTDSSIVTTETQTTTTYLPDTTPQKDDRSFLKKLFSKKKTTENDTPLIRVEKKTSVDIDTLAVARQNQALKEIEKIMREMETDQRLQRTNLQRQELDLIHANSLFISQLLNILHDVENEELSLIESRNRHAVTVMNQSITRIHILMLGFFIAAAILVYLIWIDIGKSNYYKEQLERAKDEAEELSKIKQKFLANMSHEIRTPLQSIIGFAEQLKEKDTSSPEVNAIYSSSEHLLHIVNEVLDYSRIASGTFSLAKEKFHLFGLIREIEAAMRVQTDQKHIAFGLDISNASDYQLVGDPFRLRQILYNLIGNAIKFTHRGFVKLALSTREETGFVRCEFQVIDTGIGISAEDLKRIFNQFEQVDTTVTRPYGGTGLGLSIVKSLVQAQHGLLKVSSEPGIGSSFSVELTFERAPLVTVGTVNTPDVKQVKDFRGKVLIIDDDPLILRLCSIILEKNKIAFDTYQDARAVLNTEADEGVTHVLLDIRMPEVNGVELCRTLRKKYHANTVFVALTAHVLPEERENLLNEGFNAVLPKPFHESDLRNILGMHVTPAAPPDDDLNLDNLRKMTLDDESLFQSIVTQFIEETLDDIALIETNLGTSNASAVRETIHKLAGRYAQLGMNTLAGRLQHIERELVSGQGVDALSGEIGLLVQKLRGQVKKLSLSRMQHLS